MTKKARLFLLLLIIALTAAAFSAISAQAAQPLTVSFYLDDGESKLYDEQTDIASGSYAEIPDTPAKNGSIFRYWKTKDGNKFSFATPITADTVLVAEWDERQVFHTVTFKVGDTVVSTQEIRDGADAIAPANPPLPAGKIFEGWDGSYSAVTQDTQVNAILADKEYTVRLIGFDGSVIDDTIRVSHGQDIDLSGYTPPTVANHSFLEYQGDTTEISSDTQIQLIYKPDTYDITFMSEGAPFGETAEVAWGTSVPFPPTLPEKENHIFIGWYTADEGGEMYTFNKPVSGEFSLYARFIPIQRPTFTVIFYTHDGTRHGGVQNVEEGTAAIEPGAPYREGYTFLGWNTDFSSVTQALEIYPLYSQNKYTVTVVDTEGTLKTFTDVSYGSDISESDVGEARVPVGMEFLYWDTSFKNITGDTVISAVYRPKTYVVMFFNENMQKIGVTQYVEYGSSARIPTPAAKEGYTFVGWQGAEGLSPEFITDDCSFIAKYEKNKYTVSFYSDGTAYGEQTVDYKGSATEPRAPEKSGYTFDKWLDADGNVFDFGTPITESISLYASFKVNSYEIYYYIDGELYQKISCEYGSAITPLPPPVLENGRQFVGWGTIPETMPANDVKVYGTTAPGLKNAVRLDKSVEDGLVYLRLTVTQDVEFASILASADVGTGFEVVSSTSADGMGEYHIDENGKLKLVWAYGENTVTEITLFELVLRPTDTASADDIGTLTVEDMLVFDADGNILDANYTVIQ